MEAQESVERVISSTLPLQAQADPVAALPAEIRFLHGHIADLASLQQVTRLAEVWGTSVENALFTVNLVSPDDYYRALAAHAGLEFTDLSSHAPNWSCYRGVHKRAVEVGDVAPISATEHGLQIAYAPSGPGARQIARLAEQPSLSNQLRRHIFLTTPTRIRRAFLERFRAKISQQALNNLEKNCPNSCARSGLSIWQRVAIGAFFAALILGFISMPATTWTILNILFASVFLGVTLFRAGAVFWAAGYPSIPDLPSEFPRACELPVYSILVPLYREAQVLPHLVQSLMHLDYPVAKLDIKLILEEDDTETRQVANDLNLPASFDIIVVPPIGPQTKPKALNFALQFARGKYVVIYDAEDRPEPDQLKKALVTFERGPPELVCLQARLSIYNYWQNWLTRQFTIEYAALFDVMLPAMESLRTPLPLGGTSNHFRIDKLLQLGAWDSYNVTEDADLGMRLTRRGFRCQVLDSTTFEEACVSFPAWLSQRTRWFKGWLQTLAVHLRAPAATWRELGPRGFFALVILMGGIVLSAIVYPLFMAIIVWGMFQGGLFGHLPSFWSELYLFANLWNLFAGLTASIALGWFGLRMRGLTGWGRFGLTKDLFSIPFYWLLISLAAYRAVWQVMFKPFYWEKTEHGMYRATRSNSRRGTNGS